MKLRKKSKVFFAFLLVGLFSFPMIQAGQTTVYEEEASTFDPITDLELNWIGLTIPDHGFDPPDLGARVKNNGDTPVGKYWLHYELQGLLFPRMVSYGAIESSGLPSGWSRVFTLVSYYSLPNFGIFHLTCEVNRNREVPEDNYDNNKQTAYFIAIFGFWRQL